MMECSPGEAIRLSIRFVYAVSKVWAFGSVVFRLCSVSDKFVNSFKTSTISAKFLTKFIVQNLDSMPRNLAFSVLCLVSSFEAFSKCCANAGKECQTADTALKDEATQRIVNTLPILLRVVCKSWEHWSSSRLFFGDWLYSEYKMFKK